MKREDEIEQTCEALESLLINLISDRGFDPATVLATANAHCMALIASAYGGLVAADCARRSISRVQMLPPACSLEKAKAAGRA